LISSKLDICLLYMRSNLLAGSSFATCLSLSLFPPQIFPYHYRQKYYITVAHSCQHGSHLTFIAAARMAATVSTLGAWASPALW